jgi:aldose 1-epimerase
MCRGKRNKAAMAQIQTFGSLADGRPVHAHLIGDPDGFHARILDLGGILARLAWPTPQGPRELVLGLEDAAAYYADPAYLGIVVGRFGNRVAGGRCTVDGRALQLATNEGSNHLHGGMLGFGRRLWQVMAHDEQHLALEYRSPDGEEGYPGTLVMRATYRIHARGLDLALEAVCDAATPFNPTHHPYFNLAGDRAVPVEAQWLQVPASRYLVVDGALIPTGELEGVDAGPLDFRAGAVLASQLDPQHRQLRNAGGYDHCLVLDAQRDCDALLYSPHSGVAMSIRSDSPALQLYGGHGLDQQHPGLGRGLCLEPQGYPDAPNHPGFPPALLRPGQRFARTIRYGFANVAPEQGVAGVRPALGLQG